MSKKQEQNVVVLHAGTKVSPFLSTLIDARKIRFKVIANTLLDFPVPGEKDQIGGWISKELISLATSIIKDDLTSSPLASLFSKSKAIEHLQNILTPSEQFLASWFSDMRNDTKTVFEKTIQVFDTLTSYSSLPMKVYPLSYQQKKPITIKYRNQSGSPRAYQLFGYLDLKKKITVDPADIEASMKEEKDLDVDILDEKESIIPAEIEKILKDADSVIITADDFFSLAIMLSYIDVRKSIKKSSGSVLTIAPIGSRFKIDDREKVLLEMFDIEPNLNGFLALMKDVSDTLALDSGDSDIVTTAHELGFNVIVEDFVKIEDKNEHLALILKGAGVDVSNFIVDIKPNTANKEKEKSKKIEEASKSKTAEVQVKSNNKDDTNNKEEIVPSKEKPVEVESTSTKQTESTENGTKPEVNVVANKLELSAEIAKSASKTTKGSEPDEKPELEKSSVEEIPSDDVKVEAESKVEAVEILDESQDDSRDIFSNLIEQLSEDQVEDFDAWLSEIDKYIKKDESNAIQVANGIVTVLKQTTKEKIRSNAINSFLILSESRKIEFRNVLLVWLVSHLGDADFTVQNSQYDIIRRMIAVNEKYQDFIGELLESFIRQLLSSDDMNPSKQERGRLLVQRIAYNSRKLSKYAIRSFLDLFEEKEVSHNDIWPGLSSFDARLVGIELVEGFSVARSRRISEEAKRKELGSFSALLEDIVSSWEKGDMNKLTLLTGTISESALRKAHRLSLAQNIKKVGTVPLEILARSLTEDPKELESLVYEMIMNDEIHAKLEIVDGRLYIIPIELDEEQKLKKEKPDPIELKERINNTNESEQNTEQAEEVVEPMVQEEPAKEEAIESDEKKDEQ